MIAAHNLAVANDIEPDSDEYFHTVEQTIYNKKPVTDVKEDDDDDDPMAAAAKAMPTRSAPPAAPVSRGGTNSRSMRLTPAEREAAEMSGQTEQEYAQAKEEMIKAGRIGQGRIH
jgi:phage I-like protein